MIGQRKFRLVSADARGGGTRDKALRMSAWEATIGFGLPFHWLINWRKIFLNQSPSVAIAIA